MATEKWKTLNGKKVKYKKKIVKREREGVREKERRERRGGSLCATLEIHYPMSKHCPQIHLLRKRVRGEGGGEERGEERGKGEMRKGRGVRGKMRDRRAS